MNARSSGYAVPGPHGTTAAAALASLARSPLDGYVRLAARYGDTIAVPYAPGHSFYVLSRPEHAEHVLAANQDNYVKAVTYRPLRALIGDGLLTSEGERWRQHRRLVQPVFSRRHVTTFGPVMAESARRLTVRWDSLADGSAINVSGQMSALALDIVGRALFGSDLSGDAEMMGRAMDAGQRVATLATFLPLPWGPTSTRALKALARRVGHTPEGIEGPVGRIVAGRRAAARPGPPADRGSGPGSAAPGDLLDVLLAARAQDGSPLTDAEITDEVATFVLAGHETTANTLSWSVALLSANPAARERLEEELDSVLGDRDPDAGDADKLPWTRAVVAEAMRLYPPAWTIERNALADDEVCGVPIPAGQPGGHPALPGAPASGVLGRSGRVRPSPVPAGRRGAGPAPRGRRQGCRSRQRPGASGRASAAPLCLHTVRRRPASVRRRFLRRTRDRAGAGDRRPQVPAGADRPRVPRAQRQHHHAPGRRLPMRLLRRG